MSVPVRCGMALFTLLISNVAMTAPLLNRNPFLKECQCQKSIWAGILVNGASFEAVKKRIPDYVKEELKEAKDTLYRTLPEAVIQAPEKQAFSYFETWGASIFIDPLYLSYANEKWDSRQFYLVSADGSFVEGKLPTPVNRKNVGVINNAIRFKDPKSGKMLHWLTRFELEKGEERPFSDNYMGVLKPFVGKYKTIAVKAVKAEEKRNLVHRHLVSMLGNALGYWEAKDLDNKSLKFILETCRQIAEPDKKLAERLAEIEKLLQQ